MADPQYPPDLQAAGVGAPMPDMASLLGAMRSQGSMPQGMMQALQMPQMPQMGPAQMAAAAFTGGMHPDRPNPMLQQQDQMQQQQMQQFHQLRQDQLQQQQMMERIRNRQKDEQLARSRGALTLLDGIIKDPTTTVDTLKVVGPQFQALVKQVYGAEVPPSYLKRSLSASDIDTIRKKVLLGDDDAMIVSAFPKSTPEDLQRIRALPKDERVYKALGLATDTDIQRGALDLKIKTAQAIKAEAPELDGDAKTSQAAALIARKLYGKSLFDATPTERTDAIRQAILQQRQDALDDYIKQETEREKLKEKFQRSKEGSTTLAESAAIYVNKSGNPAPSNLTPKTAAAQGYFRITPAEFSLVNSSQQAFTILGNFKHTVTEMKKNHLFVTETGLAAAWQHGALLYEKSLGDPAVGKMLLRNFDSQKAQLVILLRQLGDKGVRALGAFSPIMNAVDPSGGAPAIESVIAQIESEFRALGQKSRTPDMYTDQPTIFQLPTESSPLTPATAPPAGFTRVPR